MHEREREGGSPASGRRWRPPTTTSARDRAPEPSLSPLRSRSRERAARPERRPKGAVERSANPLPLPTHLADFARLRAAPARPPTVAPPGRRPAPARCKSCAPAGSPAAVRMRSTPPSRRGRRQGQQEDHRSLPPASVLS
eukprot:357951-Chlamydomonas_euryale.AAC.13